MKRGIWFYRVNFLVLFCVAVLCWSLSGNAYRDMQKQPQTTTFQNVEGLTAADYEPMLRSEAQARAPLAFCFWAQADKQHIEGLGTGRTQAVSWVAVKGDVRLLFPAMQTLFEDDAFGCLIDRTTAEELFRSGNVVGSIVKMGGKEYTVRGVIDGPDRTMVTQLAGECLHPLTNITVSGTEMTETFLLRHELLAANTVKTSQHLWLARIFHDFPVMAVLLVSLLLLGLLRGHWQEYPIRKLLMSIGMLGIGTITLFRLFTVIPEALIPTQWSDFEFWETAGRSFMRTCTDYIATAKYRPDLTWLYGVLGASWGIVSALFILYMYSLVRIHIGRPQV